MSACIEVMLDGRWLGRVYQTVLAAAQEPMQLLASCRPHASDRAPRRPQSHSLSEAADLAGGKR